MRCEGVRVRCKGVRCEGVRCEGVRCVGMHTMEVLLLYIY